jgi:hypothetical protein
MTVYEGNISVVARVMNLTSYHCANLTTTEFRHRKSLLIILLEVWSVARTYAFNPLKVRFQSTKSMLSIHPPSHTSTPLPTKISFRPSVRVAPSFEPSSPTGSLARVMFLYICSVVRDQLIASDLQIGLSRSDNEHAR